MTAHTADNYQQIFRSGSAFGRSVAIADALREISLMRGIVSAGGEITAERLDALHESLYADYDAAHEEYRKQLDAMLAPSA
jgi:hypothetical protein